MTDTTGQKRVPNVRFKGFTDDWEQRKLEEISTLIKSYSFTRKYETNENTGTKYIHYGDIHTGKVRIVTEPNKLPTIKSGNYTYLDNGDIVVADASEDYKGIADASILLNKGPFKIVAGLHTIAIRPNQHLAFPLFLYYQLQTNMFKHYGYRMGTGLKVFGISSNIFLNYASFYSTVKEQEKISKLIILVSRLLSLYQQKISLLKQLKQGMLQKLFTGSENKQPILRFNGYHGDWEQRKLGEVSEITAGGDKNNSILRQKGKYPVIANAINTNGIIGYYDEYYRIKAPALTVTGRGDIGHATARFTNFTPVVRLLALTTSENVTFLANAINNIKIYNESTGVPQLTKPQLSKYKVAITSGDEENLIATLLEKLDNQITLYQNKINTLTNLKKFLLQQMFI